MIKITLFARIEIVRTININVYMRAMGIVLYLCVIFNFGNSRVEFSIYCLLWWQATPLLKHFFLFISMRIKSEYSNV